MKVKNDHRSKFSNLRSHTLGAMIIVHFQCGENWRPYFSNVSESSLYRPIQFSYYFLTSTSTSTILLRKACTASREGSLFSIFLFPSAPCALLKCDFYAECSAQLDGSLQCVCPTRCPLFFNPVCGSDGYTYPNQCTLQVESCKTRTRITVVKQGQCGA